MNAQPIQEWIKKIIYPSTFLKVPMEDEQKFILLAAILFDRIWWCRNEIIFNQKTSDPRETASYITKSYLEHLKDWDEKFVTGFRESNWKPYPIGWLKFNFDVVIRPNKITVVVCCRNDIGEILHACSKSLPAGDRAWKPTQLF
jgi:hypothetical protein